MSVERSGGGPMQERRQVPLANEAFKRGWSTRVAWSIVLAAVLHIALFSAFPAWHPPQPREDASTDDALTMLSLRDAGGGPAPAPALYRVVPGTADGTDAAAGTAQAGSDVSAPGVAALWDRIAGSGGLTPTVVAAEPVQQEAKGPGIDAAEVEGLDLLGARRATAELGSDLDSLVLDRLSVMRPELALTDPTFGILVRNPLEIDAFMQRRYEVGELVHGEPGLVGVALWIDERGSVRWAEIDQSSGRPAMDEVALELFREVAVFRPARQEGVPVSRSAIFWVRFPWVTGSAPFVRNDP